MDLNGEKIETGHLVDDNLDMDYELLFCNRLEIQLLLHALPHLMYLSGYCWLVCMKSVG